MSDHKSHLPLEQLVEELAALEHRRWAHWQKYVHDNGRRQPDGSIVLPSDLVVRWDRQINTKYADLSVEEKESDREQVRKYLPLLERWLIHVRKESNGDA
ncbi:MULTISPECIES: hypothetical protein [Rhodopseudomonas]|uniref:Uncharacterized protein n=1 Tax=Rhodopseudomonas palustris TaxID=1076 RepID=A0A0D7EIJ5_RHOPL|nr:MULTISPECIES: hypothetical protein [Rhodopseudomonas]KIZ40664.1 hypothetical protein OO17_17030 [Rhodopseudomonas palustris]MDF3813233.1 hypothetical protein [Rhodopseudomonas sp. BAL398]WOK21008.1 hypothetical protein RBJ75_28895 [Rhodopseudomonas sp. BAL398]